MGVRKAPTNRIDKETKICKLCAKAKSVSQYYKSSSQLDPDGLLSVCKPCINDKVEVTNIESVRDMLLQLNKPYLDTLWVLTNKENERRGFKPQSAFGLYLKNIYMNHKELTWKDSEFETNTKITEIKSSTILKETPKNEGYNLNQLKSKYGFGYPDDEYYLFEDKYQQLKTSFQLLTTMHEEYFREFCVNKVKETLAKAKGNFKEAKEWAAMVKDVAEAGKLKPSQMSKADLSGGLDTFGQLARMVEENHEIMSILPQFTQQPKDKVDVTLWCYINYVRDLKGLPECDYKEIYAFYDKKKQDYESQMSDNSYTKEEDDLDG